MSHLDPERIALLAIGEPATADDQRHLDTCDDCTVELATLEYTVAVGRSTGGVGALEAPPERVWQRIVDETGVGRSDAGTDASADGEVLADVAEPREARPDAAPARRRWPARLMFGLAAGLALIVTVVGVWTVLRPAPPVAVAAATLDAFPAHPDASGEAVVVELPDGERQLEVHLSASDGSQGYREVWLITADASALVSLGVLQGSDGVFTVPADVDLEDFVLVDISLEPEDGDPTHSGDSIVRGELSSV